MSRSRTKHDYPALRLEYIQSDISVRELCRKHDIASWSTVNAIKKREQWDRQRDEFRATTQQREISKLVDERMSTVATIHAELLLAIRAGVHRYVADVQDQKNPQHVSARDLMGLIDKFLLLTGQATSRSENRNLDVHDFGGILRDAPPELLRELAELARANGAGAEPMGRGPLIVLEGTRSA